MSDLDPVTEEGLVDLTDDEVQSPLYTHPSIRSSHHDWLLARLQQIRDRRLVAAMTYESKRVQRAHKVGGKLQEQWEKLDEANRLKLAKIDDMIDAFEANVTKQIQVSHQLSLVEDL